MTQPLPAYGKDIDCSDSVLGRKLKTGVRALLLPVLLTVD